MGWLLCVGKGGEEKRATFWTNTFFRCNENLGLGQKLYGNTVYFPMFLF